LKNVLALPCVEGEKTPDEKFPGAETTYTLEVMSQNGKAIQAGTSHFLGQNFSKSFEIKFDSKEKKEEFVWTTSWGVSTRLLGALLMVHSDDEGLVLPPAVAPIQILINPILDKGQSDEVKSFCEKILDSFRGERLFETSIRVQVNPKLFSPGENYWKAVKKGVPIVLEVGPRDVKQDQVTAYFRHEAPKTKHSLAFSNLKNLCCDLLKTQQNLYYEKAAKRLDNQTVFVQEKTEFQKCFQGEKSCFVKAFWHPDAVDHPLLKELQVTPRCLLKEKKEGRCLFTGQSTSNLVIFAKSY
jgi:prolyl-tRNA synthetase